MAKKTLLFEGGMITLNEGGPYVKKDGSAAVAEPSVKIGGVTSWGTMPASMFHSMLGKIQADQDFMTKLKAMSK